MMRRSARADAVRIAHVLAGVAFPAAKWQLIIQGEDYGADATSRADLWRLPSGTYPDLVAVLAALGLAGPGGPVAADHRPVRAAAVDEA